MRIYIHKKCSTCANALSFLKDKFVKDLEILDIVETPPTIKELKLMLMHQQKNIKKLLNTSGILYREMGLTTKLADMDESHVLKLLSENGMLVKRPFLLGKDFGLVGFKPAEYEKI